MSDFEIDKIRETADFKRMFKKNKKTKYAFLFILPALLMVAIFYIYPTLMSFRYSFTDWDAIKSPANFIGLDNFISVLTDKNMKEVFFNTFYLALIYVPFLNIIAIILAVIIINVGKFKEVYKSVIFFPNVLSMGVMGYIWAMLYNADGGAFNLILEKIGLGSLALDWLGNDATVLPAISLTIIWFASGYYFVIYMAGLLSIPTELYESADIDGAKTLSKFKNITIPMLAPSITINVVLSTVGILSFFDLPFVMTRGGPGYSSSTIALQIYTYTYPSMQPANGVALSVILCLINILVTFILLKFLRRGEETY